MPSVTQILLGIALLLTVVSLIPPVPSHPTLAVAVLLVILAVYVGGR